MARENNALEFSVETLAKMKGERLNETSRECVDYAGRLMADTNRDNAIMKAREARAWLELALKCDKQDADRIVADLAVEFEAKKAKAKKRAKLKIAQ